MKDSAAFRHVGTSIHCRLNVRRWLRSTGLIRSHRASSAKLAQGVGNSRCLEETTRLTRTQLESRGKLTTEVHEEREDQDEVLTAN